MVYCNQDMMKKNKTSGPDAPKSSKIFGLVRNETKQGILAIIFFAIATLFILASVDKAGFVGATLYNWFELLLGLGYFLVPLVFIMLGMVFLKSIEQRFPVIKLVGSIIFFISGLGMIDLVAPGRGGIVGSFVGTPLVKLFDLYAS